MHFAHSTKPPSGIHLCLLNSCWLFCKWVLMISWGYANTHAPNPATPPVKIDSQRDRTFLYLCLRSASLVISQAANCPAMEGISLAMVLNIPLQIPLNPSVFRIYFKHSVELWKRLYPACILILTSSTGLTTNDPTIPEKAPASIPERNDSPTSLSSDLQSSYEPKDTALMSGTVMRGQYIPLKRAMKPSFLTILLKHCMIVIRFSCTRVLMVSRAKPLTQFPNPAMDPQNMLLNSSSVKPIQLPARLQLNMGWDQRRRIKQQKSGIISSRGGSILGRRQHRRRPPLSG